ncbi:hypothetical protein BDW22DRAFT_1356037 [Trametopsis cervina]|nr:hypothetical protein BDW22DRAFT_1356037 [Trametopsis cervina]
MELKGWITAPFKFHPVPVSVLVFLLYAAVFTSVLVTDETPGVPKNQRGLDLCEAYNDLHAITARPRPVTSHANDAVHDYILHRLRPIVNSSDYTHLSEDFTSNATYSTNPSSSLPGLATYYEGTNILVKIDGTDAPTGEPDGVVFSAHYDSVSTAPGATDNGMSVVTLIQMAKYLAHPDQRPRRTAVFLFNNGEEDGLNGVHMYFEHPWSNLTSTFFNFEGAAAGGRPVLFRSTSLNTARSFTANGVRRPHGNAISADAFSLGIVRSRTDYEVFAKGIKGEKKGMDGLDFAFYKNRAFYHTKFDSIPGMGLNEARRSLWSLMETARGAGLALLNDDAIEGGDEPGVYFDILGRVMVTLSAQALFALHVTFLIVGPVVVIGMLAWLLTLAREHLVIDASEPTNHWSKITKTLSTVLGWGRFWISLLITIGVHAGIIAGFVKLNPFTIYAHPSLVLTATLATTFLALGSSLKFFSWLWPSPPSSQKFAIILEIYLLSWILLVVATVLLNNFDVHGVYLITVWNVAAWLAAVLALSEAVVRARSTGKHRGPGELDFVGEPREERQNVGHRFVGGVRYEAPVLGENGLEDGGDSEPVETEPTEITPLMQQQRRHSVGGREYVVGIDNDVVPVDGTKGIHAKYEESGWWIFQMLMLIPAPTLLLFQIDVQVMHSLRNTLADGSSPVVVYGFLSAMSLLIFIQAAPFAHNIHRLVYLAALVVLIASLVVSWTAFPFTPEAPLKVFFQQSVELSPASTVSTSADGRTRPSIPAYTARAVTKLTGVSAYTDRMLIPELPSAFGKNVTCETSKGVLPGLSACSWQSDLIPSPGGSLSLSNFTSANVSNWFSAKTVRLNDTTARFIIQGVNTRSCFISFSKPITSFEVLGSGARVQPGYEAPEGGLNTILLWSRTWGKEFAVEATWGGASPGSQMEGRIGCNWAEYASGTAGSPHADISAQIPAYEEALSFLPMWAILTKWGVGLAEVWTKFSV